MKTNAVELLEIENAPDDLLAVVVIGMGLTAVKQAWQSLVLGPSVGEESEWLTASGSNFPH